MDIGLGAHVDVTLLKQVLTACCVGTLIGLERQLHGKPAGVRTSILITIGAMLFMKLGMVLSVYVEDQARVLAQIVTGIGFLGAGVILSYNGALQGVTSAAIVWVLAAIGAAIGVEHYAMAITVTSVILIVLVGFEQLEKIFPRLRRGVHAHFKTKNSD